ncbi:MAG: hypothetical protein ACXWDO_11470, partial [Bacteroidia bacterium]
FTIDQISNSKITVELIEKPEGKKVKFTANGITESKVPFTFRIKFNSSFGSVEKTIEAELENFTIYGKWFFVGKNSYAIISDGLFEAYTADGTLDDSGPYDKIKNEVVIEGSDGPVIFKVTTLTKTNLTLTDYVYNEVLSFERR